MSNIIESTEKNIKFPLVFMNDEISDFIERNELSANEIGGHVILQDSLRNQVSYLKETYDRDVIYKKA